MQSLRFIKFFLFYNLIVFLAVAQTPFQGHFGFFGSGQSNNATPVVVITAPATSYAVSSFNQTSITVSGTCSIIGRTVTITVGGSTLGSSACSSSKTFSTAVDFTTIADGPRLITATMTNAVGTSGSASVAVDKDVVGPVINFASDLGFAGGSNSNVTFTVTERHATTSNYVLEVSQDNGATWAALGSVAGTAGNLFNQSFNYNWNPVNSWNLSTVKIKITATDSLGQSTTKISSAFVVDSGKPVIDVGSFSINLGAGSTSSTSVRLALTASDTYSNITQFCFKHTDPTEPTLSDGCWTSVTANPPNLTPATTFNLSNFPFSLPPVFGTYDIYAWVRDSGGNISALSNSGAGTNALDKASIIYVPPVPATIINVIATSTDSPSAPTSNSDLTIPAGSSVFIKWNAADNNTLPNSPISLYYTTDDINYTLIATNVDNAANAGCTISGSYTGCYRWTNASPLSTYYRVRATVVDSDGSVTASSSAPLNVTSTFNLLAGNTDPGTGGSASAAMFINTFSSLGNSDPRSFVITSNGTLYFIDDKRGLIKVDPSNGVQELLIKNASPAAGDGLAITNPAVTLNSPNQIIADYQDNLYIYEYARIRKIDMSVNPPVISTLAGGGASLADDIPGSSLKFSTEMVKNNDYAFPFFAVPNGRIYFRSDYATNPIGSNAKLRYYDPSTGKIRIAFTINGVRSFGGTDRDISYCQLTNSTFAYDTITSDLTYGIAMNIDVGDVNSATCPGPYTAYLSEVDATGTLVGTTLPALPMGNITNNNFLNGMDGKIYAIGRIAPRVIRYEPTTKTWTTILGTGIKGSCIDGTLATSCDTDIIDAFVSKNGTLYVVDRARIRMVDPISKKIYTLYGQNFSSGDGGNPLSARFSGVSNVKVWSDSGVSKYVAWDYQELRFREFTVGGTIETIAGTGAALNPDTTNPANTQPVYMASGNSWLTFGLHPTNGRIYFGRNARLSYINRTTGRWADLVGGGSNYYNNSGTDGLLGNQINVSGVYTPFVLDVINNQVFTGLYGYAYNGVNNSMLKLYDEADGKQNHYAGITGFVSGSNYCASGTAIESCSLVPSGMILYAYDSFRSNYLLITTSGNASPIVKLFTVGGVVTDYATLPRRVQSFAYRRDSGLTYEWFYYCDQNGKLYKYNNLTAVETQLTLPATNMTCNGRGLFYSASRGSLVFGMQQNGLGGVAEYPNP